MTDDEELDRLARDRHRATYLELEQEKKMGKFIAKPGEHDEPDVIPGSEPSPNGCRMLAWGMIAFWALVIGGIALLYSCRADAAGRQVYLEGEDDLGNGYKLCHYSEGVTITIQSHKLCPLSINV